MDKPIDYQYKPRTKDLELISLNGAVRVNRSITFIDEQLTEVPSDRYELTKGDGRKSLNLSYVKGARSVTIYSTWMRNYCKAWFNCGARVYLTIIRT